MKYQEFIRGIQAAVEDRLGNDIQTKIQKIVKNNNIKLDGLIIMDGVETASPTIYLNEYYHQFSLERTIEDIAEEICDIYEKSREGVEFDVDRFQDFERAKKSIAFKLVNREMNEELLREIPYESILDLAIIYYYIVETRDFGIASAVIGKEHLTMWDITKEELLMIALENTKSLLKPKMHHILDVMDKMEAASCREGRGMVREEFQYEEMIEEFLEDFDKKVMTVDMPMFVLTNEYWTNGAACIFYTGLLEQISQTLDTDLYIIPSSIHEVILLPLNEKIDMEELDRMIQQVNQEDLKPGEVLSHHVYMYRRTDKKLTM